MAIMIPFIPQDYTPASGEDRVFNALRNLPSDPSDKKNDYYVFHSFKINRLSNEEKILERHEIDFVIFHPEKGILCIECKNGKVISENREWYFAKIKNGILQQKKKMPHGGPFRQAEDRKENLLKEVSKANICLYSEDSYSKERIQDHCKFIFAVCFPGVESLDEEFKIETVQEDNDKRIENIKFNYFLTTAECVKDIVIFGEDLRSPETLKRKIDNIFSFNMIKGEKVIETGNNGKRLQDADIKNLFDKVLCPNFHIAEMVDDDGAPKYIALNNEQQNVLKIIQENDWKEAAISGLAGTGKTVLALQLAKEKAANGKVLYICINNYLQHLLKKYYSGKNIDFTDIDWICEEWLKKTNSNYEDIDNEEIYKILRKKIVESKKSYKTVIIDEGQDFGKGIKYKILYNLYCIIREVVPVWQKQEDDGDDFLRKKLQRYLNNPEKSFYIFYDEGQKNDDSKVPEFIKGMKQKLTLKIICRNIPNIAITALKPKINLPKELCQRILSKNCESKVKMNFYDNADEMKALLETIIDDISKKDNDTVILTCKNDWSEGMDDNISELTKFKNNFVFENREGEEVARVQWKNQIKDLIPYYKTKSNKKILFAGWKKFKGLDKRNVILIEFEPDKFFTEETDTYFSHFYVGVTRARDNCYILAPNYVNSKGFEAWDLIRMAELYYEMRCKQRAESGFGNEILSAGAVEDFWSPLLYAFEKRKDNSVEFTKFFAEFCNSGRQHRPGNGMGYILYKNPKFAEELEELLKKLDINEGQIAFAAPVANAIDKMDFLSSIKQRSEQERRVHKKSNDDFLRNYNKWRHGCYRDAICKALNAENLYPGDNEEIE